MDDISLQLRRWSGALADSTPVTSIDELEASLATTPGNRSRQRLLAAAASVVVVAAGITAIAVLGGDDDPAPATPTDTATPESSTTAPPAAPTPAERLAGFPSAPTAVAPVEEIPLLLPTAPMPGDGPPAAYGATATPIGGGFHQVFADAGRDVVITLRTVVTGPIDEFDPNLEQIPEDARPLIPGAALDRATARPVDVDGWDAAYHSGEGGEVALWAAAPDGWVHMSATGLNESEVETIVRDMRRRGPDQPGWDLPRSGELVEIAGAWEFSTSQRRLVWFEDDQIVAEMWSAPGLTFLVASALGDGFEQVEINGAEGWYSSRDDRSYAVWSPDGINLVLLAVTGDQADALDVARGVVEASQADYDAMTTTAWPDGFWDQDLPPTLF